jgi:FkbM family methyltransferase
VGLALRHRLSAFSDAVGEIEDRAAFVLGEVRCVPLRPLVQRAARSRGSNAAVEWQRLGSRLGYLRQHRLARGGHVWLRHGTADVFTVAEVLARNEYAIPDEARRLLPERPRVVDLGANIGVFGIRALRDFAPAVITSVEADPYNASVLRRNAANVPMGVDWKVLEAFAAPTDEGTVDFAAGHFAESRSGAAGDHSVPTVDALALMNDADLVKIDIEGAEWPILEDQRLSATNAAVVVLEYHQWGCDEGEDPSTRCRELLSAAGFSWRDAGSTGDAFGTLWAWRPA